MNVWQDTFPGRNTGADGYLGTAPSTRRTPSRRGGSRSAAARTRLVLPLLPRPGADGQHARLPRGNVGFRCAT